MRRFRFSGQTALGVKSWLTPGFIAHNLSALAVSGFAVGLSLLMGLLLLFPASFAGIADWAAPITANPLAGIATWSIYTLSILFGSLTGFVALGLLSREREWIRATASWFRRMVDSDDVMSILRDQATENPLRYQGSGQKIKEPEQTACDKMLDNIWADAKGRRYDPIPLVVSRVDLQIGVGSRSVRGFQTIAIRLGILGTFIGLIAALVEVQQLFLFRATAWQPEGPPVQLVERINELVGLVVRDLALAFGTSIAGLTAAIILQFLANVVRSHEADIVEQLQRLASEGQTLARKGMEDSSLGNDIEALRGLLKEHKDRLYASSDQIRASTDRMNQVAGNIADEMEDPLAKLGARSKQLADVLTRQSESLTAAASVAERIQELNESMASTMTETIERAVNVQTEALEGLSSNIKVGQESLMDELRNGFGRDARSALESDIRDRLEKVAESFEGLAYNQHRRLSRLTHLTAAAAVVALVFVIAATLIATGIVDKELLTLAL